jgi:hypothetical protein
MFTKYIILIGKFERNALLMGFLYISVTFFGDSVMDCQESFVLNTITQDGKN